MIDMWYHELPDWTETNRYCPETDIDNIKATKLIMGHDIVACEEFYVHNNIVIYLERKKTVTRRVIAPCIHESVLTVQIYATSHDATQNVLILIELLKMQPSVISIGDKIYKFIIAVVQKFTKDISDFRKILREFRNL